MKHVLGVSLPRSGHHYLVSMLREYLHDGFSYCEFYQTADCCRQIPCTKSAASSGKIYVQKSHDFQLTDPVTVDGAVRLIQFRSPVPRLLSDYELWLKVTSASASRILLTQFLQNNVEYTVKFHRKWLSDRREGQLAVSYEQLTADPLRAVEGLLYLCGVESDRKKIARAIQKVNGRRSGTHEQFKPRMIQESCGELLPLVEKLIVDGSPGYLPMSLFGDVEFSPETRRDLVEYSRYLGEDDLDEAMNLARGTIGRAARL